MPAKRPEGMSDEMWAAVCIVMEDQNIKSFKEMTESHKAVITRMDQMEDKWAEREASRETSGPEGTEGAGQGGSGTAGQAAGGTAGEAASGASGGSSGSTSGGTTPPPKREDDEGASGKGEQGEGERVGSGRGGRLRWYERDVYGK